MAIISYQKHFHDTLSELKPKLHALNKASLNIYKNKRFHKILEYVLALGNFMNKGARGNAYGFKLNSLLKLVDTRSSNKSLGFTLDEKILIKTPNSLSSNLELNELEKIQSEGGANMVRQINLCHYLVSLLPKDILQILPNLDHINTISSSSGFNFSRENLSNTASFYEILNFVQGLNFNDVKKEIKQLEGGHNQLKKEIAYLEKRVENGMIIANDDFLTVMKPFQALVNLSINELNDDLKDGEANYLTCIRYYCEDEKTTADVFFSNIFEFLKDLIKCRDENEEFFEKVMAENKKNKLLSIKSVNQRLRLGFGGFLRPIEVLRQKWSQRSSKPLFFSVSNDSIAEETSANKPNQFNSRQTFSGFPSKNKKEINASSQFRENKTEDFDDLLSVIKSGDLFSGGNGGNNKRGYRQSKISHGGYN